MAEVRTSEIKIKRMSKLFNYTLHFCSRSASDIDWYDHNLQYIKVWLQRYYKKLNESGNNSTQSKTLTLYKTIPYYLQ